MNPPFANYMVEGDWEKDGFIYVKHIEPLNLLTGWHTWPQKLFDLIGIKDPVLMHNQPSMLVQEPHKPNRMFPPHQDAPYNRGVKCTIWTPLTCDHKPSKHGSLYIGVGSHRLGELLHTDYSDVKNNRFTEYPPLLRMDIGSGTAIVMHPHLIHASVLNEAETNCVSIQWRYADAETDPELKDDDGNYIRATSSGNYI